MATTSLWSVRGRINDVLLYAKNSSKTTVQDESVADVLAYAARSDATGNRQYVWGINCNPQTASCEMISVKRQFKKEGGVIAYHGYQSFKQGEVTPEQAHQIGIDLAQELWGDRYQVLVATHLDKASHLHTHFVINTVSFVDGERFHRTKRDYARMQEVSDRLCREAGLSVIRHPQGHGKHYSEWSAEKTGKPTNRSRIRTDIDRAIRASITERNFYECLESWGYEFKFYGKNGYLLERPSLRPKGAERFVRFDGLGEAYTIDEIRDRILENIIETQPFDETERFQWQSYRKEHPPHTKAKGLAALYYYYCYELHILVRFPSSVKRVSQYMREDLRKLEQLDEQTIFLAENKIETIEALQTYRTAAKEKISDLTEKRNVLRTDLKRTIRTESEEEVLSLKKQISSVTCQITQLRTTLRICDRVEKRAGQLTQEYRAIQEQIEKGEQTNELFSRSSGPDRTDVAQRR